MGFCKEKETIFVHLEYVNCIKSHIPSVHNLTIFLKWQNKKKHKKKHEA